MRVLLCLECRRPTRGHLDCPSCSAPQDSLIHPAMLSVLYVTVFLAVFVWTAHLAGVVSERRDDRVVQSAPTERGALSSEGRQER